MTLLTIFAAFCVGLAIGLNRARRSWSRGFEAGALSVTGRCKVVLFEQARGFGLILAGVLGTVDPVPASDEVEAEMRRHGEAS